MAQVNLIAQIIAQIFFFLISFLDTENREGENIYDDL